MQHSMVFAASPYSLVLVYHAHLSFLEGGFIGVDVFFVLSGFLITSILRSEYDTFGTVNLWNFYARRFLRLVPCLWLVVGSMALWSIAFPSQESVGRNALVSLTYTMNWSRALGWQEPSMFIHTWSLACEEQFYLVWPLLMVLLCGLIKGNRQRAVVLLSMFVLLAFYRWAMTYHWGVERIYNGLDTRADGLLLGAAVAMAFSTGRRVVIPLSGLGGVVGLGVLAAVSEYDHWHMLRYGYFACASLAALVVWDCVSNPTGVTARMLSNRALVYAGKISYGIYLWHYPVFHALKSFDIFWAPWRVLLVGSVLSLLLATVSYYLVERKFLAAKGRFVRPVAAIPANRSPVAGPVLAGSIVN